MSRADAMQRASTAWQLRVAGKSWDDIAADLGYENHSNVIRAVRTHFGTLPSPAREELRALARARGEVVWSQALRDVLEQRPGAVRAAVAVLQRQSALDGLDQPHRLHVEVGDDDMRELVAELSAVLGTNGVEVDPLELTAEAVDDG